ncbi:MAG: succinate--CoA ligase subunit alpha [Desulfovibrio sp.]|uniref:succinate--CoA ligase subunit alpha n=1 Tax=Desulfovibrio sp. 7SRBS1 TaxID=3378064 RepID=UPI003B4165E4
MQLNEHLSKVLFVEAEIPTPQGILFSPENIGTLWPDFSPPWVLKAQVLAGGRGKAGGVRIVDDKDAFVREAGEIFGLHIKGKPVPLLRVEPKADIAEEFYLSFTVARNRESMVLTVSGSGGVDVESVADKSKISIQNVDVVTGPAPSQVRTAFFRLGLGKEHFVGFAKLVGTLFKAVRNYGLLLAEINPLVLTSDGQWLALDGKVEIDDNVRDMRTELDRFYEPRHASAEETASRGHGLSFVTLDGWVGLLANGAGLAMATMDLLNFSGLPAANFLDLGGTADQKRMEVALKLLFGDKQVRAVFINLFGGILSCESVALALKEVLAGTPPEKPLVVRFAGNGAAQGREVLDSLKLPGIHSADDMGTAMEILSGLGPRKDNPPVIEMPEIAAPEKNNDAALPIAGQDTGQNAVFDVHGGSKVLVQGITGKVAMRHVEYMQAYGTNIVAGVTPFKGGQTCLGVPVYNSVYDACLDHDIDVSIIFVPAAFAADAILEAGDNNLPWTICITEGISQQDMLSVLPRLRNSRTRLIGPNTPGMIVPGQTKIGILPADPFTPGNVAVFSRSGTLTYEASSRMSAAGFGQSFCVGIGGDPFIGQRFTDLMAMARNHEETKAVLVLGEIGGRAEEDLAEYIVRTRFPKPVLAFIAGQTAPRGKRLGHAGAILEESGNGVGGKLARLAGAGIHLCRDLESIPGMVKKALKH